MGEMPRQQTTCCTVGEGTLIGFPPISDWHMNSLLDRIYRKTTMLPQSQNSFYMQL